MYPSPEKVSSAHGWQVREVIEDGKLIVKVIMVRAITTDKRILHEPVSSWHIGKWINHEVVSSQHARRK